MRVRDSNRQRRLLEYRPLDATKEEHAMTYHRQVEAGWKKQAANLSKITNREPNHLVMFSEDAARQISEERALIYRVTNAMAKKDLGIWTPIPQIGDIYAQRERPKMTNFETIRNPTFAEAPPEQPSGFLNSKYYKKRVKELRSFIEKIRPFEPDARGLVVVGTKLDLDGLSALPPITQEETIKDDETPIVHEAPESVVSLSMSPRRLVFRTVPGETRSRSVCVMNEGTTAIYYSWEIARDVELMVGAGSGRASIQRSSDGSETFDWQASESFNVPRNLQAKVRSEFCFAQRTGSIRPGCSVTFAFAFKSDVPGCFTQRWMMRTTPLIPNGPLLSVSLRGCCEVDPPDLSGFKESIRKSVHESERTRCISEILGSVVDRVGQITALRRRGGEDRIDGDVLVDDRAPAFDAINRRWGLVYSPGLYRSLLAVAERCWDALGIAGFDRFWDMGLSSLSALAMRVQEGELKRTILGELNEAIRRSMTVSAAGSLAYSLAYVQLTTMFEELPQRFMHDAAVLYMDLPLFIVPKPPDPGEIEEALESAKKKHRGKRDRKPPPPKKPVKKGGKAEDETPLVPPTPEVVELTQELKDALRITIREQLRARLLAFENLATESRAVGRQLTRVNEIERLETNLDAEVEDEV
jgi:hypothetical protein